MPNNTHENKKIYESTITTNNPYGHIHTCEKVIRFLKGRK